MSQPSTSKAKILEENHFGLDERLPGGSWVLTTTAISKTNRGEPPVQPRGGGPGRGREPAAQGPALHGGLRGHSEGEGAQKMGPSEPWV